MPFMFEREGDFTELLIPANLLADDSVLSRAVKVLTTDVCQDVEVIGWLYQFYISERKDEVFAGFKKNKKAGADEIPAATQLFTPHWIVRYLVENSLGRLWMLNRPSSRLVDQMEYYIAPVDEETDFLKITSPEELKVIDPACGSGHMLTYAFDLLYAIYEEEGYAPAEIPEPDPDQQPLRRRDRPARRSTRGVRADHEGSGQAAHVLQQAGRAERLRARADPLHAGRDRLPADAAVATEHAEAAFWNQFERRRHLRIADPARRRADARLRQHLDAARRRRRRSCWPDARRAGSTGCPCRPSTWRRGTHVVVANPPYMGSGNMDALLAEFAKDEFPASKSDLFAMFIERVFGLAVRQGYVGDDHDAVVDVFVVVTSNCGGRHLWESITSWSHATSGHEARSRHRAMRLSARPHSSCRTALDDRVVVRTFRLVRYYETDRRRRCRCSFADGRERTSRVRATTATFAEHSRAPDRVLGSRTMLATISATARALGRLGRAATGLVTGGQRTLRSLLVGGVAIRTLGMRESGAARRVGAKWFPYNKGGDFRQVVWQPASTS